MDESQTQAHLRNKGTVLADTADWLYSDPQIILL